MTVLVRADIYEAYLEALNRFVEPIYAKQVLRPSSKPTKDTVYHYTDAGGALGVIANNSLWATCTAFCNDRLEYHHGKNKCLEVIDSLGNGVGASHQRVLGKLRTLLGSHAGYDVFAVCLSFNGDQLSQWRGYADQGSGFALGFHSAGLETSFKIDDVIHDGRIVVYENDVQDAWIKALLVDVVKYVLSNVKGINTQRDLDCIADLLESDVGQLSAAFKHSGFAEEAEYRLIVRPNFREIIPDSVVSVRASGNQVLPFIALVPQANKRLPLTEIIVGPRVDFDKARYTFRRTLGKHGFNPDTIKITASTVPFV